MTASMAALAQSAVAMDLLGRAGDESMVVPAKGPADKGMAGWGYYTFSWCHAARMEGVSDGLAKNAGHGRIGGNALGPGESIIACLYCVAGQWPADRPIEAASLVHVSGAIGI